MVRSCDITITMTKQNKKLENVCVASVVDQSFFLNIDRKESNQNGLKLFDQTTSRTELSPNYILVF